MESEPQLTVVIPVFNGARSIGPLVARLFDTLSSVSLEIVLVNDGSADDSEQVCSQLAEQYAPRLQFVQLFRNFGEHNAVLAGLKHSRGAFVAIMDDDAQQAPRDVLRMLEMLRNDKVDVVYGRYEKKEHHLARNLGSWFNDRVANVMLKKPHDLYLSSFKLMNRRLVDEICNYAGPFPYIDGLVLRTTDRIGQMTVSHFARSEGRSNYTFRRLVRLWLNMFVNFSILPLRLTAVIGISMAVVSALLMLGIVIDKIWISPNLTVGIPTVLVTVVFFAGTQMFMMGMVGEYLGRVFLHISGTPQYIVRYVKHSPTRGGGSTTTDSNPVNSGAMLATSAPSTADRAS